jgi:broad specificity phosphatase PhoE
METSTSIHFVRHGAVHNPQNVFYGRLEGFPLSQEGRRQARAAAEILRDRPIAAVFSSPLLRAVQTAEIILSFHHGLSVEISEHLNEVHCPFDGQPRTVLDARDWDVYTGVGPEYEQPGDVFARTMQFVAEVRQRFHGQQVVAATHGDIVGFMMLFAKGAPVTAKIEAALAEQEPPYKYPAPTSIASLHYMTRESDEVPRLEYVETH